MNRVGVVLEQNKINAIQVSFDSEFSSKLRDSHKNSNKPTHSFSILEKLNSFIEIGQAMWFSMKGCEADIKKIITQFGDLEIQ